MPKTPIALLASTALLLPAAVIASPTEAASEATATTITNCSKTRDGVTVRIKIRDEGRFARIRVSHPRGKGNFKQPKVKRVSGFAFSGGGSSDDPRGPGAIASQRLDDHPSFRESGLTSVSFTFRLKNGKKINLSCQAR